MKRLLLLLPLLLTSCIIPVRETVVIGEKMTGRVIDKDTQSGIAAATIRYADVRDYETTTDATGRFDLQPQTIRRTYWLPPAPCCPPPWWFDAAQYQLVISAPGYPRKEFPRIKERIVAPADQLGPTKKGPDPNGMKIRWIVTSGHDGKTI